MIKQSIVDMFNIHDEVHALPKVMHPTIYPLSYEKMKQMFCIKASYINNTMIVKTSELDYHLGQIKKISRVVPLAFQDLYSVDENIFPHFLRTIIALSAKYMSFTDLRNHVYGWRNSYEV